MAEKRATLRRKAGKEKQSFGLNQDVKISFASLAALRETLVILVLPYRSKVMVRRTIIPNSMKIITTHS
jgi:hypothetical protein